MLAHLTTFQLSIKDWAVGEIFAGFGGLDGLPGAMPGRKKPIQVQISP